MSESLDRSTREALIQSYLEGSLTEAESRRLLASLRGEPSSVRAILDGLRTDWLIRTVVAEAAAEIGPAQSITHSERPKSEGISSRHGARGARRPSDRVMPWPRMLTLAASVGFLLSVGIWYFGPTMGKPLLEEVSGQGVIVERGAGAFPAARGMQLAVGDVLSTGTNGTAFIRFGAERTTFALSAATELKLTSLASGKRFDLRSGSLRASVARQRPFAPLVVTTPNAEARVVGTRFMLKLSTNSTRLEVFEGKVRLSDTVNSGARRVDVAAGQSATVAPGTDLAALPQTGSILRECWTNLPGGDAELDFERHASRLGPPARREWMKNLSTPRGTERHYGARWRGFLHPPISGDYGFTLAASQDALMFISEDERPENKMNRLSAATMLRDELPLRAGRRYYIEVVHKVGKGAEHLSLTWNRPDGKVEVISGEYLSPFAPQPQPKDRP